ncbi:BTB/POZ domain-containing protein [Rhizophagus clarus]|uniref:BTB/POZ domain-containing protein n=1 Tax=Rhizophagus clarus TaxID=94130 RepID=A0A8H3R259_9GLOM|nr:BTB/POZ domain-containing protein [Rhizophagus clarus]
MSIYEIYDRTSDNVKVFDAHSSKLRRKCEYFQVALSEKWARKIDDKYKLCLEVSIDAFEKILNGICNGKITLNDPDTDTLMELMLISDILLLQEFFDYLRSKLNGKRDKKKEWSDDDIFSILRTSYRIPSTQDLYLICQDVFAERPSILFNSPEFPHIEEELLMRILKLDMICLPEIEIFNKVIEWGIANTPDYHSLPDETSKINALGATLEDSLRLIQYKNMSEKERLTIRDYEQILPTQLVRYKIPPRSNLPVEPKAISSRFAGLIAMYVDRKDPTDNPYSGFNSPLQFRHVFRMNDRSSFYNEHHKYYNKSTYRLLPTMKCYHGRPSLMIIKLKGSGKIIGAYNPIDWKQDVPKRVYVSTSESFLFTCDDRYGTNFKISRVRDYNRAICLESVYPSGVLLKFGEDLTFSYSHSIYISSCINCNIKNKYYEQLGIADGYYNIEEWDVYKIHRKDDQPIIVMNKEVKITPQINLPVETKIVDNEFFELVATWIDRKDPVKDRYPWSDTPFTFTPLFRMNDRTDFYNQNTNHYNKSTNRLLPTMKCHHGPSLMIMKLKTSGKIIGAYNPVSWKQKLGRIGLCEYETTSESFIFSCDDKIGTNWLLSRVKNSRRAICSEEVYSLHNHVDNEVPNGVLLRFGEGLKFYHKEDRKGNYSVICDIRKNDSYEQPAIMPEGTYTIEEWEIFRVTKRDSKVQTRTYSPIISGYTTFNYIHSTNPSRKIKNRNPIRKIRNSHRKIVCDGFRPHQIIEDEFVALISTWIDGENSTEELDDPYDDFMNIPFQFTLLFRMNCRSNTHEKYYNQSTYNLLPTMKCHHGPSLMIMRIKDSEEIIGAYNPINWKSDFSNVKNKYVNTTESFIFSSKDEYGTDAKLNRVITPDKAMSQMSVYPNGVLLKFGEDLSFIYRHGNLHTNEPDYGYDDDIIWPHVICHVKKDGCYEQPPILPEGIYEIDGWEIYRVVRTDK